MDRRGSFSLTPNNAALCTTHPLYPYFHSKSLCSHKNIPVCLRASASSRRIWSGRAGANRKLAYGRGKGWKSSGGNVRSYYSNFLQISVPISSQQQAFGSLGAELREWGAVLLPRSDILAATWSAKNPTRSTIYSTSGAFPPRCSPSSVRNLSRVWTLLGFALPFDRVESGSASAAALVESCTQRQHHTQQLASSIRPVEVMSAGSGGPPSFASFTFAQRGS